MTDEVQVVEQKIVLLYEDELVAVRVSDGHIYVSLRHLCAALRVDSQAQTRRIRRQTVLEKGLEQITIMTENRGPQLAYMLRVDLVPLFLSGISTKAVADEVRPKLESFQEKAAKVLWEAFQEGRLTETLDMEALLKTDSPAAQAYQMAAAIMKMARQQLMLEEQVDTHATKLLEHEQRIEEIESALGDTGRFVTPDQAMQISQAVKTVAISLGRLSKRNEFGAVYGELYRKFGITSYKALPAQRFEKAMSFLTEWHQSIVGDGPF